MPTFDPSQPFTQPKPAFDEKQPFTQGEQAPAPTPPPAPNNAPLQQYVKQNMMAYQDSKNLPEGATDKDIANLHQPQRYAESYLDAVQAGFQTSVTGLVTRNQLPDTVLPENAGMAMRVLQGAGQLAGDIPAMVAGGIGGGLAGTAEAPVLGTVAGATAGMWALPSAMRRYYMDSLQKGDVKDFGDFFERAGGVAIDGLKGAVTGVLTEGLGALGGSAAANAGAPVIGQTASKLATELGVMTTVGKAMDGQVPHAQDFLDGALLLGAVHGVTSMLPKSSIPPHVKDIQTKLQEIYAETGVNPSQVTQEAMTDPNLKQQLQSTSPSIPDAYKSKIEAPQKGQEILSPPKPPTVKPDIPAQLDELHSSLNDEFSPKENLQVQKFQKPEPPEPPKAKEPPSDGSEPPPPTDKEKILSRIGESTEPVDKGWDNWYSRNVDKLNPINKLAEAISGGEKLDKNEDPYALFSTAMSRGFAKADELLNHGYTDPESGEHKDGMKQILARFPDDTDGLKAYGMAKRALELEGRGVKTGFDLEAAKNFVTEEKSKYEDSFRDLVDLQNHGMKNLSMSGFLTPEQFKNIRDINQDYFPFNRAIEGGASAGKASSKPIKEIHGSELHVIDPFEQIIKNQYAYSRIAEDNLAKRSVVDLAQKFDAPSDLLKPSPVVMKPTTIHPEELAKYLGKYGIHEGDPETMQIFRPLSLPLGPDEFATVVDGKREVYTVDPSVAKALSASNYSEPHGMVKIAAAVAKAQRVGMTENPFFLLTHAVKDQFRATIQSQNGYRFAWDGLRALGHYFSGSEDYMEFLRNGGGMSTLADFDKNYVSKDVWGLSKETGLLDKALNVIKTPFELQHALAQAVFTAPKLGEYLRGIDQGKDPFTAAYEGKNVTANIQKRGSSPFINTLSSVTPFFNIHLQGMDRMAEAFKTDPSGTAMKAAVAVTLPSLALWWAYKDEDWYKNQLNYERDLYWNFRVGDTTMRLPKPDQAGLLFGSLAERTMDEFYRQKPEAFKGFGSELFGTVIPNFIPPAVLAPWEHFANKNYFTGRNIVPEALSKEEPAQQYNAYTTESGKMIAKALSSLGAGNIGSKNITLDSPMVLENYVRAWTGDTGLYALQLADKALEKAGVNPPTVKPAWALADIPYVKAFFTSYPSANAQPIQDFYDNLEKTNTAIATVRGMAKRPGGQTAANAYLTSYEGQENMMSMTGVGKAMGIQSKMVQAIYANPDMKPDEKRQQIDTIYGTMIQMAIEANKTLDNHRKQLEAK